MGQWMYRPPFSSPTIVGEIGHLHALAALPPRKEPPVPFEWRLGGPQSRCGRYATVKLVALTGTRTSERSVFKPVGIRYTDNATEAHSFQYIIPKISSDCEIVFLC
jgi:hypothetical protein